MDNRYQISVDGISFPKRLPRYWRRGSPPFAGSILPQSARVPPVRQKRSPVV